MSIHSLCMVTFPSQDKAVAMSRKLLESKMCACVNMVPKIHSLYWWQGKIEEANEVLLLIKTETEKMDALITAIKTMHPYEVPEIISFPIDGGNLDYLKWISDSIC